MTYLNPDNLAPLYINLKNQEVPTDVFEHAVSLMPSDTLGNFAKTCHTFFAIARNEANYRYQKDPASSIISKVFIDYPNLYFPAKERGLHCFNAVTNSYWETSRETEGKILSIGSYFIRLENNGRVFYGAPKEKVFQFKEEIISVYAHGETYFALSKKGKLYGWGRNDSGLLAQGNYLNSDMPKEILIPNKRIKTISVSAEMILAITMDNKVFSWGSNLNGQLGLGPAFPGKFYNTPQEISFFSNLRVNSIYAGDAKGFVIADGELFVFGANQDGSLGLNQLINYSTPQKITLFNSPLLMLAPSVINTFAVTTKGELYEWGKNFHNRNLPIPFQRVDLFKDKCVVAIMSCGLCYIVLTNEKELYYVDYTSESRRLIENAGIDALKVAILDSTFDVRGQGVLQNLRSGEFKEKATFNFNI